jgi:hypothetical protein
MSLKMSVPSANDFKVLHLATQIGNLREFCRDHKHELGLFRVRHASLEELLQGFQQHPELWETYIQNTSNMRKVVNGVNMIIRKTPNGEGVHVTLV